ncbi:MAG: glutaminase [Bacteroidales bacterium]|nr:glutaminase [Bacteroidales bacterium]
MQTNYQEILENIVIEMQPFAKEGKQADYIPALAKVDPDKLGICLTTVSGETYKIGDADEKFSIQSISKVFSLAIALSLEGKELWKRVGKEPSGSAFNSLVQLEYEHGIPRNPFINAGAIVVADVLLTHLKDPKSFFLQFVRSLCDNQSIDYSPEVAESELACGYLNASIAYLLKYHGNLQNEVKDVLEFYSLMCSMMMSCTDLSRAFLAFAESNKPFCHGGVELTPSRVKRINAIMQTCGFYDEAGEFSFLVGLPGKSGVGGGIVAIYPSKYAIATWSPRLNNKGNSIMGMKILEEFTTQTSESIF